MPLANRIANLQARMQANKGKYGADRMKALQVRLDALKQQQATAAPAGPAKEATGGFVPPAPVPPTPEPAAPPGMSFGPNSQEGVQPGFYRTANGQIIPIRQGLVPSGVYNAYRAANPQLNAVQAQLARTQAMLFQGERMRQQQAQEQWGYLLTPENLAALGMNPETTGGQLTPSQINALTRVAAGQQIASQVAATDEAGQAALAAGGRWAGPVPQAGGIGYTNPVPDWWTGAMASEVFQPAGAPLMTRDAMAGQHPGWSPALLDQWQQAYEQALAQYTAGGV